MPTTPPDSRTCTTCGRSTPTPPDTTTHVWLDEFVTACCPPWGGTWDDVMTALLEDPIEQATIATLLKALGDHNTFDQPVLVEPEDGILLNGCHRVIASLLAGHHTIQVEWATTPTEPDNRHLTELEFDTSRLPNDPDQRDTIFEHLANTIRSFPTSHGCCSTDWNESYGLTATGNIWTTILEHDPTTPVDTIIATINQRCTQFNIPTHVTNWWNGDNTFERTKNHTPTP